MVEVKSRTVYPAMTSIPCVWSTGSQSGLESMGLLCREHCLGSVVPLGEEHFLVSVIPFSWKDKGAS